MKRIIIGLFISVSILFAKDGYVDVNVLLIKKYPSDQSVKYGYYKKYTEITILETHDGIDNDDKWYLTNRGYVRAKYVVLNEDLPTVLLPQDIDTSKYAIQLAVYPKRAKYALKEGIRKLQGEDNVFVEETSRAKVLYLANFSGYRAAVNKLNTISAFKGFVTKIKLKNNSTKSKKATKVQEVKQKKSNLYESMKIIKKDNSAESVKMDDETNFKAIMKEIYKESEKRNEELQKKPKVENVEPKVLKKDTKEKYIDIKTTKVKTKSDYNMNRELSKTLEKALIELDSL